MKPLSLSFLPRSADCALLILRLWFGLTMLLNHGWGKLAHFSMMKTMAPNPLHLDPTLNMAIAVLCELVCPFFVIIGCITRLAALLVAAEMAIAFIMVHHMKLAMGPGSGELPFLYLGAFAVIFVAGSGRHAVCPD